MYGLNSWLATIGRGRLTVLAIGTILGLLVLAAPSAHAAGGGGCDTWTNTAGGSWFTGGNWSKNAPPSSEEEACITANGTYTVAMTQTSGTVTLKSLTVGGASGTQTLVVASSCSLSASLTTTAGITVGAQGAVTLTNGEGCGTNVKVVGPINDAGSITSEPAHGGTRELQGSLTNTGKLTINTNTLFNGTSALLTNEGTLNVAENVALSVSNGSSVTNGAGGSITAAGTEHPGDVSLSGGAFTEGAGTTSGAKPVIVDDGALAYTGAGASTIALHGESSTLSGASSSGQSLSIESTCGEHAKTTAASGFTNGGAITLTNFEGCGNNASFIVSSGTLTNSGTITIEPAHGGQRTLQGNITNTGTIAINVSTAYNGSKDALINEGAINVAEGITLTTSNGSSVTNGTGGKIAAGATGGVLMASGTAFTEGTGTTSGAKPVVVDDAALTYTGAGASALALHGESSTLSGNLSKGQSLSIESTCGEHAKTTAASGFTNGGAITLTNFEGCGNNASLVVSSGTLTNSGTITTETAHGGSRQIQGNVTNTGTLAINSFVSYNGTGAALDNEGTIEIAEAKQLTVSNGGSVTNGTGGVISVGKGADLFAGSGTSFTEGAGTTSGGEPVIVDDGTLTYTGAGASQIALRGTSTLSGSLSAAQSLSIQSTCGEHATPTAAASFTNAGTIILTNGDGCGNNAILTVTSPAVLTNSGKIISEPVHGGERKIQGNITNTGTIVVNTNTGDSAAGAGLQNNGSIDIATGVTFSLSGGETFTNGLGGSILATGSGALVQTGGTYNQGLGTAVGAEPVILDDLTLNYTEHGSGPIALRGSSTLGGGNVKSGETLLIESTCGEHAVVTAAGSFTNNGVIELTNGDGCGNNVTLDMKGGGTLTNTGVLNVDDPHGGSRTIEGNLTDTSEGFVLLTAGETLHVVGNYTQTSLAKLKTQIASTSSFGALAVTGLASLGGKLKLIQMFTGSAGQTFPVITSGSLTGAFALESEGQINASGLYYKPTYTSTGVTLVITQAKLTVSPESGPRGSTATVTGSGFLPGDTIELKFSDRHDVLTPYPSVTVNGSGEFSAENTIPASAALKGGEVKAKSVQTGAKISTAFTVTT